MLKNITLHIVDDYAALSTTAAEIFTESVEATPSGAFGFATGGTPEGMYEKLSEKHLRGEINLSKITAFNLDEYARLSPSDPQSYAYFMATHLFDKVGLPNTQRNIPRGDTPNPIAECSAYEKKIQAAGGIKLQILGIGNNGHVAFIEPHPNTFASQTSYVALAEDTISANSRYFEKPEDVPTHALSMGIQTIMMAETIMMLASGESKAEALKNALTGAITPLVPASALQLHRNVIVIADRAAAKLL